MSEFGISIKSANATKAIVDMYAGIVRHLVDTAKCELRELREVHAIELRRTAEAEVELRARCLELESRLDAAALEKLQLTNDRWLARHSDEKYNKAQLKIVELTNQVAMLLGKNGVATVPQQFDMTTPIR